MVSGSRTGTRWWDVYGDENGWHGSHSDAPTLTGWIDEHLMTPHPDLGRDGAVCPFVQHSASRNALWAGMAAGEATVDAMHAVIDDAIEVYGELVGESRANTALITVFPGLTDCDRIDDVHRARKTDVVRRGWMLGQFYPGCTVPGLWNRQFRPLDAPLPMLVLRPMMSTDFPFLVADSEWLYAYLTRLAPNLPRRLRWEIAERMRIAGPEAADITALRAHSPGEHAH
ncbi:hypothetical protein NONO_c14250 [Nocardia nova SH22a]|uniref:DUF6875 domain-containing protein n=1 Tax=Nocardia nova SH22a TaxID=1415166 RepID=W5TB69_9NOCA|nr:hypothetical protein NONO_c14250 [Nocardia nova SH22a]